MKASTYLINLASLGAVATLAACSPSDNQAQQTNTHQQTHKPTKPNLVIILADDLGYADVGFNGCQDIPTPNIDLIANSGVVFKNGYVTYPVCGPSRAGLLTGRYQDRFGFTTNPTVDPQCEVAGLPIEEEMISEALQKANYKSAIIGKWHMGSHPKFHPLERGWDYFYGFLTGGHHYLPHLLTYNGFDEVTTPYSWYKTKIMENRERIDITNYLTDELSDAAVRFIKKQVQDSSRFCLYLSYNAPHTPLQATEKYLSRFDTIKDPKRKVYAAMVSAMDDGIGRVMQALQKTGIEENTIVVFLSDNGGPMYNAPSGNGSNNAPLRGHKAQLFEGGIHVPFAMQWKGKINKGLVYEHAVSSLDIMATIVAHAGVTAQNPLDGVDLIPYVTGQNTSKPHDMLFWRKAEYMTNAGMPMAIRHNGIKLVTDAVNDTTYVGLYELKNDLAETNNLLPTHDSTAQQMKQAWQKWNNQMKPRYFPTLGNDKWWERNLEK